MRIPPVLLALAVALVLLATGIVLGLTSGRQPLPHCTPRPGVVCQSSNGTAPTVTPSS